MITLRGPGATLFHSNHVLYDQRLAACRTTDESPFEGAGTTPYAEVNTNVENKDNTCEPGSGCSSVARLKIVQQTFHNTQRKDRSGSTSSLDVEAAKKILESCPAAHAEYSPTIASVVMDPSRGQLYVRFLGEKSWASVYVSG